MNRCFGRTLSLIIVGFAIATGVSARAEIQKVATVLNFVGFDLIGQRNPLTGGFDFLATDNFNGAPFDFGAGDLSLNGPLSLQVSAGGRLLPQFDVSLTTAVNGSTNATPLSYVFSNNIGGAQSSQISGTVLADVNFSLNALGFYDLGITYSSRQNVTKDGLPVTGGTANDFDLGPVNISGNLYADILAMLTDPIFNQAGQTNPFDSFSGRAQLSEILQTSARDMQTSLADGSDPSSAAKGFATVPEPAVLMLMLLGIPAILARQRRRRHFQN
jgi:hypothetical protein